MNVYFFTFRSITLAQRGEGVLPGATLSRTPRWMDERGCGYSLRIRTDDPARWAEALRRRGIEFRKVYRVVEDSVEEVAV